MPFYDQQALDCVYIERCEWELFAVVVDGNSENEEKAMINLPLLFARRLAQEVEHMRTAWVSPSKLPGLIQEGIKAYEASKLKAEVSK